MLEFSVAQGEFFLQEFLQDLLQRLQEILQDFYNRKFSCKKSCKVFYKGNLSQNIKRKNKLEILKCFTQMYLLTFINLISINI